MTRTPAPFHCIPINHKISGPAYLETRHIRHDIGPDAAPVNHEASVLGVSAHGARPVALVEAAVHHFRRQRQPPDRVGSSREEGEGGAHFGRRVKEGGVWERSPRW